MGSQPSMLKNVKRQIRNANKCKAKHAGNRAARLEPWQDELKRLKLADMEKRYPAAFIASGGYSQRVKPYSDKTTNQLTRSIIDFLNFSGHYANRIGVQGQARVKRTPKFNILSGKLEQHEKVQWTKSTTKRGTPDVDSIVFGKPVKIEIKAGRDRIRNEQTEQGKRITDAGGIFYVATDMPAFLKWYKETFITFNKK